MRWSGNWGRSVVALMGLTYARVLGAREPAADAESLLRAGQLAEAERAFAARAAARPKDARPLVALGHLALLRNDLTAAAEHLTQALRLAPKDKTAKGLLAELYYRRDDFASAAPLFAEAGQKGQAEKLRSFAGRPPYTFEGPAVVRLPFVRRDPLPVVKVRVNDGPEVPFLLDTGGGELILGTSFADGLGVRRFGAERGSFGGGTQAAIDHGVVDKVTLADLAVRHVPVRTMDVKAIGAAIGEPELSGIIGTVLFYRLRATLDYPGQQLVLERKDAPVESMKDAIEVPFLLADDHYMLAQGTMGGGPPLFFFVDTGLGGGAFTAPPATFEAAGIDWRRAPRVGGTTAGGVVDVRPVEVPVLTLGAARREHLPGLVGVFPPALEWEFGFRVGGLISHEFFLPYAVTFDFARMIIHLAPGSPISR